VDRRPHRVLGENHQSTGVSSGGRNITTVNLEERKSMGLKPEGREKRRKNQPSEEGRKIHVEIDPKKK